MTTPTSGATHNSRLTLPRWDEVEAATRSEWLRDGTSGSDLGAVGGCTLTGRGSVTVASTAGGALRTKEVSVGREGERTGRGSNSGDLPTGSSEARPRRTRATNSS